ncbi:MAG: response regulator [Candidatus Omnitrophota bacterium]
MSKKVMIIEDIPLVLGILTQAFKDEGYEVVSVENGEEGVKKSKSENPDLVIIDTILPGIDGFEVCKLIKKGSESQLPKVIMMTGTVDAIDAVKARKMGADDYCAKTSDLSLLVEAANKLLSSQDINE